MSAARQLQTHADFDMPGFLQENRSRVVRKAKSQFVPAILTLAVLALLFSVLVLVVYRYATIAETKYAIFTLKKEINELSMKKEELHYQIDTSVALDNIEKISTEQLGMTYPNQGQMIYIEPIKGYNLAVADVLSAKPEEGKKPDFVDRIAAFAARFR